ncbi:PEP-CTERM sorting domain-containing protein [Mangrovitalea sediminis]|uniref:PEP-CTERM sorting domain-containing protein n=1 Tax=Mangrovitalea sediminis TaxID=1982043 RepID=UPI000BE53BCF|nr:PEP-CTERM sorting domain-containing protein [Mangrovitalea sediminis]
MTFGLQSRRFLFIVLGVLLAQSAQASLIQLFSTNNLSPSDTIFSFAGTDGESFGASAQFSDASNTLRVTGGDLTGFVVGSDYLFTAFPDNTPILYGYDPIAISPLTLSFSHGISEVGFEIESASYGFGAYSLNFTAFNGSQALGSFDVSGDFPNSLGFLGIDASGGDQITSLTLNAPTGYEIALGAVQFANAGSGGTTAVSEPSTVALMGLGLLGLISLRFRPKFFP